ELGDTGGAQALRDEAPAVQRGFLDLGRHRRRTLLEHWLGLAGRHGALEPPAVDRAEVWRPDGHGIALALERDRPAVVEPDPVARQEAARGLGEQDPVAELARGVLDPGRDV